MKNKCNHIYYIFIVYYNNPCITLYLNKNITLFKYTNVKYSKIFYKKLKKNSILSDSDINLAFNSKN